MRSLASIQYDDHDASVSGEYVGKKHAVVRGTGGAGDWWPVHNPRAE